MGLDRGYFIGESGKGEAWMKSWERGGRWGSLSSRLAGLVLITYVPVNLFAILVVSVMLIQSSRQVQDSYQRELDTTMGRLSSDLEKLEEGYTDFLTEYMFELTVEKGSNRMATYDMLDSLHDIFESADRTGIVYLSEKMEEKLFLRYTSGAYSVTEVESIKNRFEQESQFLKAEYGEQTQWSMVSLPEGYFLNRRYEYANYYIGLLLDMEKYLEMLEDSELWQKNQVYLQSDGKLYAYKNGRIRPSEMLEWEDIFEEGYFGRSVQWTAGDVDLTLGVKMSNQSFQGGVPPLYWAMLAVACGCVFLALGMWAALKKQVVRALLVMQEGMRELEQDHVDYRIKNWDTGESEEFIFLYESFNHMAEEIGASREKDAKMYQTELDNLRLQVNPHMLLNSFNMIYSLAQSKNFQCIQEYSLLLVEYFRYALKETNRFVTLDREMAFVESYIGIQKIRFPGAFTSVYNIQEGCMEALVPPLLIENFVENAMKYALIPGKKVEVLINIRRQEERLLISVCDTGRGIKPEVLDCLQKGEVYQDRMGRGHIGIWNCRRRMEVFYGNGASMNIISEFGQGTQVWLDIPFLLSEEQDGGKRPVETRRAEQIAAGGTSSRLREEEVGG